MKVVRDKVPGRRDIGSKRWHPFDEKNKASRERVCVCVCVERREGERGKNWWYAKAGKDKDHGDAVDVSSRVQRKASRSPLEW